VVICCLCIQFLKILALGTVNCAGARHYCLSRITGEKFQCAGHKLGIMTLSSYPTVSSCIWAERRWTWTSDDISLAVAKITLPEAINFISRRLRLRQRLEIRVGAFAAVLEGISFFDLESTIASCCALGLVRRGPKIDDT
jgi:hypothetical protein